VIDACAGLAYVTLATFLGYSFGLLLYRTFASPPRAGPVGAALGIVSNMLRVRDRAHRLIRGSQILAAHARGSGRPAGDRLLSICSFV
jgi:hypothetical protein